MHQEGPRNIGLSSIKSYKFPITAISSILHRVTGILMVISIPFLVWMLSTAAGGFKSFDCMVQALTCGPVSVLAWLLLSMYSYHIIAGIRHMLMDIGFGESMSVANATSVLVLILGIAVAIFWGLWIWVI